MLNYNDAYYYKILLMSSLTDTYFEWLNSAMESEPQLNNITLELAMNISDTNKTISILNQYCIDKDIDEDIVAKKLLLYLKNAYNNNQLTKEKVSYCMYRFAIDHDFFSKDCSKVWSDMYNIDDYYSLASCGAITWENFDKAFNAFLNDATPIDHKSIYNHL